eukprot:CAMPEP_0172569782 /NCGR_PEP_ID=MMETSP1067-20121228/124964_1 /TAXON_ID=265564 ORGANISM="Thalassiosira punctigera, Strain Tpunct2005C2" /NCGR_SAMPLE_ID=MMETSP1067 /ASSEMBLY_ACC=CAM_ASM_000444 /LENGTH=252 /DNA_ID=CAMNT_0013361699 /DNA_START=54 /DNA_END=812 /DNA_ORIENTATION=+
MSVAAPGTQKMERGSEALRAHVSTARTMSIRQTRKGWFQECLGCEAQDEYKFFKEGENEHFATALEQSSFCLRCCLGGTHPFKVAVVENGTNAELLAVDRPCRCAPGGCKCCCYQEATFSSGGQGVGSIKEQCFCCVPRFKAYDGEGGELYKLHPPTCMGGCCVNCCAEGNPCGKGCCKASFRIYPAAQDKTDGDAPYVGQILKKPKSAATEIFTSASAFDVSFPESANADEKALLMGSALFFNANFFEKEG